MSWFVCKVLYEKSLTDWRLFFYYKDHYKNTDWFHLGDQKKSILKREKHPWAKYVVYVFNQMVENVTKSWTSNVINYSGWFNKRQVDTNPHVFITFACLSDFSIQLVTLSTIFANRFFPIEQFCKGVVAIKIALSFEIQSNPYIMFAANLQPSWPSRPKTKGPLLFYFLRLYNFGFYEIFVESTSSELQHPWISKISCEPKKSRKNNFSGSILKYL